MVLQLGHVLKENDFDQQSVVLWFLELLSVVMVVLLELEICFDPPLEIQVT